MKNFIKELNENQLKAVTSTKGYIRVVAGPGSGKTRTLASRYGKYIVISFADEMLSKIDDTN